MQPKASSFTLYLLLVSSKDPFRIIEAKKRKKLPRKDDYAMWGYQEPNDSSACYTNETRFPIRWGQVSFSKIFQVHPSTILISFLRISENDPNSSKTLH